MTELTPEHLAAIQFRDQMAVPRFLSPFDSEATRDHLQAEMDRRALLREVERLQAEAEADTELPRGLVISEDSKLLNWRGVNYVRQGDPYGTRKRLVDLLDEVAALRRWKTEMLKVLVGLQELGDALDLRLGDQITGTKALEAVNKLRADADTEREHFAAVARDTFEELRVITAERDAYIAENKHLQSELRAALGAP